MMLSGAKARLVVGAGLLAAFLLANSVAMHNLFTSRVPGANDFYARWRPMRAWLFEGRSPYADSVIRDTQLGMYGRPARPDEDKGLFSYPLYSALFFAPPALIASYAWASAVWLSVLELSLLALVVLSLQWSGWRPPRWLFGLTVVFSLFWYHSARTLLLGQFAAVEALMIVGALLALRAGKDAWAGLLLALCTAKVQMVFLLLPGLLLWAAYFRRWKVAAWFAGAMVALLGLSFILLPTWLMEWRAQLGTYVENTFIGSPVSVIASALFPGFGAIVEYGVSGILILYLLWEWWRARRQGGRRFEWAAALTLVVTNVVALRTATTNYVMMLPALFLIFHLLQDAWGRLGLVVIALIQTTMFVGLWALFLLSVKGNVEQPIMYLPLPLTLLAGLLLCRRAVSP